MNESCDIFNLGSIALQNGGNLPNAHIAYKTFGELNAEKDNVILYPTWFTGFISNNEWLIGENLGLNPKKYFIIIVCAFGNGQSSSPSNTPAPFDGPNFPKISLYDNVIQQHRFVTEKFGISKIKIVIGWSMGAQQTFQWGCLFPEMVASIIPMCGSAKTAEHNFVFLEGVKAALVTDKAFEEEGNKCTKGLIAVSHVYAGWGFSQSFYRKQLYRKMGFTSLDDFFKNFWEAFFLQRDPHNLLCMLWTWQHADISANTVFNGDLIAALKAIKAKTVVMPAEKDLYFTVDVSQFEVDNIPGSKLVVIPGDWGHFAADGLNPEDTEFIDIIIRGLLESV